MPPSRRVSCATRSVPDVRRRAGWLAALALAACGPPRAPEPEPLPALILISLDGFRADYLDRGVTPHLSALAARGVRARWLAPTFPAKTFPQHYTIVTGLYPGRHGIIANNFVDRSDGVWFRIGDTTAVRQPRWWGGEPIWVTAERQGGRAFSLMWPGSEAPIAGRRPSRVQRYDEDIRAAARVDSVLAWLALPASDRPRLITAYFEDLDWAGHEKGPDAPETDAALQRLDAELGRLFAGIERLGRRDVNIIVVSDHGMQATSLQQVVLVTDLVDTAQVRVIELGAYILLDVKGTGDPAAVLAALRRSPHLRVFRDSATPPGWRLPAGPRVPAIVGVPEDGWLLLANDSVRARRRSRPNGGEHGYAPESPAMRALFIAAGPAFRRGVVVEPFTNIHVYELLAAVLGVPAAPNDGSLDSVRALLRR